MCDLSAACNALIEGGWCWWGHVRVGHLYDDRSEAGGPTVTLSHPASIRLCPGRMAWNAEGRLD